MKSERTFSGRRVYASPAREHNFRGFSLIEMMLVVAIIGLLASIAIPAFKTLVLKSKASERAVFMRNIARAMTHLYQQHDTGAPDWLFIADVNPPAPITGYKKLWLKNQPGWSNLDWEPDGSVYYHYSALGYVSTVTNSVHIFVTAESDLDGDGIESNVMMTSNLDYAGSPIYNEEWLDLTPGEW